MEAMTLKKRILFYNNFFVDGGVEVFQKCLAQYLADIGYDVTCVATPRTRNDRHHPYGPKVKCVWRPFLRPGMKKYSFIWIADHIRYRILEGVIKAYLSLRKYDIVVAAKEKYIMRNALTLRGKRYFAWIHMDYSTRPEMHTACFANNEEELECMRRYEKVVCVSEATRKGLVQTVGDPGNLIVKYVPIDTERILHMSKLPCPVKRCAERPLIVSVGRLSPEKQYPMLLRCCAALHREIPFDLWLIGNGKDRPIMEEYIEQEHLDFVHLLGAQENPYHYLAQADLFVSSSRTESYGLAVQEALILGVPVVAVRCPGIEESLDPRFGVLTDNSEEALEDGIRFFLSDPDELRRYREAISNRFDRTDMFEKRLKSITDLWENGAVH